MSTRIPSAALLPLLLKKSLVAVPHAWLACSLACARMEPPPGGPEDRTRPFVAGVYPAPGATNVPRELKARVAFSEWVNRDAERGKVWLSPPAAKPLKVVARGDVLDITSESPLEERTTYVLGISGAVKDLVGQPLEAPFQLVFSTGPVLDSGILGGRLTAFPGNRPPPGAFAALYPIDRDLRRAFGHLRARGGPRPVSPADSLPNPFRERPAYLASADSLGRFGFEGVRPGNYLVLGFQDLNLDGGPDAGSENLAVGPAATVGKTAGAAQSLALAPLDTAGNRLLSARWVHEGMIAGRSFGTVRLKFARPLLPGPDLHRGRFRVRKAEAAAGASVPVMDICLNPDGEVELYTAPLEAESAYVAVWSPMQEKNFPDPGPLRDTTRGEAPFRAALADSAAAAAPGVAPSAGTHPAATGREPGGTATAAGPTLPVFLAPRTMAGAREKLPRESILPAAGLFAYFPRILTDSAMADLNARLEVRSDTVPIAFLLTRISHHEFLLKPGPLPLKGQTLTIGYRVPKPSQPAPGDSVAAEPAPGDTGSPRLQPQAAGTRLAFTVADSSRLGSLRFRQDATARGARVVLRAHWAALEIARTTPAGEEFTVDSLPAGKYAVAYFRDADGDSLWNAGSLRPWRPQEAFVHLADTVEVKPGAASPGSPSGARLAFPPGW